MAGATRGRRHVTDYPTALEENLRLADGTEILLRPIRDDDGPLLQDLLANMSDEDRRRRFFSPIRTLSENLVQRLSHVDYRHDIALLALMAGTGTLLGVVRLAGEGEPKRAEYAITLRSDYKGHGLGWLLMQRMLDLAARLGFLEVYGYVLRENEPMLRMAREFGFVVEAAPDEPEAVLVRRPVVRRPVGRGDAAPDVGSRA
jgi:acetyltransferase